MYDKICADIISALKSGDRKGADILKFLKSKLDNIKIELGHDLNDEEVVKVIRKEIKSRVEARDLYQNNGRQDLADKEEAERIVYTSYLPKELSRDEINAIIKQTAADFGSGITFTKLMPEVIKNVAGRADGRTVSEAVKKYLEG